MTLYYTIEQDIDKRENTVNIYEIYNNYPHYQNTLFFSFDVNMRESIIDCLIEQGYENFEISRL